MNSKMFANGSPLPDKSARRRATVTISAPLAASASRMASGDENFPVPMMSRERKIRPAMTNGWFESDIADNLENSGRLSRREESRFDCDVIKQRRIQFGIIVGAQCKSDGNGFVHGNGDAVNLFPNFSIHGNFAGESVARARQP